MTVGVGRGERAALVVVGPWADPALSRRTGQRTDGAVEPESGEARSLAPAWAETGTPEQALGLRFAKRPCVAGNRCHRRLVSPGGECSLTRYFLTTSVARIPRALWLDSEHQRA